MASPVQTSIDSPLAGLPGAPCDDHAARHNMVETCLNEEASAAIPFGYLVKQGSTERKCKLPSAKTDHLIGFSTYSPGFVRNTQLSDAGIMPKTYLGVTRKGRLWIMPEEDVAVGDGVHGRITAASQKLPGMLGKTDNGVASIDLSPFAQWRTAGGPTTGQPAKLEFDFTNASLAHTDS